MRALPRAAYDGEDWSEDNRRETMRVSMGAMAGTRTKSEDENEGCDDECETESKNSRIRLHLHRTRLLGAGRGAQKGRAFREAAKSAGASECEQEYRNSLTPENRTRTRTKQPSFLRRS